MKVTLQLKDFGPSQSLVVELTNVGDVSTLNGSIELVATGGGLLNVLPDRSTNSLIPIAFLGGAGRSTSANIEQATDESSYCRGDAMHRPGAEDLRADRRATHGVAPTGALSISENGDILLAPAKNMNIRTAAGELHIAGGAIVLVMSTPEATALYNLHDARQGAVTLVCAGQDICIAPGKAVIVTSGVSPGLPIQHPARSVGYRKVNAFQLSDGSSVTTAQFSIPSALQTLASLQAMLNSRVPQHQKAINQIMKTAAVLSTVRGQAEPYRPLSLLPLVSSR